MDTIVAQFKPILDALGVEPWMYPLLIAFGIAHQYAKGTVKQWNGGMSMVSAMVFSLAFGIGSWFQHELEPLGGMTRIVVLLASALIAEYAVGKAAEVVPFIPKNNEWVKEEKP